MAINNRDVIQGRISPTRNPHADIGGDISTSSFTDDARAARTNSRPSDSLDAFGGSGANIDGNVYLPGIGWGNTPTGENTFIDNIDDARAARTNASSSPPNTNSNAGTNPSAGNRLPSSRPNSRSTPDRPYIVTDPFDNRYDFLTGQKVMTPPAPYRGPNTNTRFGSSTIFNQGGVNNGTAGGINSPSLGVPTETEESVQSIGTVSDSEQTELVPGTPEFDALPAAERLQAARDYYDDPNLQFANDEDINELLTGTRSEATGDAESITGITEPRDDGLVGSRASGSTYDEITSPDRPGENR